MKSSLTLCLCVTLMGLNLVADAPDRPSLPVGTLAPARPKTPAPSLGSPSRSFNIPPRMLTDVLINALGQNVSRFCSKGDALFGAVYTIRTENGKYCSSMPGAVIAQVICKGRGDFNTSSCNDKSLETKYLRADNKTYTVKEENNLEALLAEEIVLKGPAKICGFMAPFVKNDASFLSTCTTNLNKKLEFIKDIIKKISAK